MTFGEYKTNIEKKLIDSYQNKNSFKKQLKEFKSSILDKKDLSKLYSLYDQLSTPQGLSQKESEEFLKEGVELINRIISSVKLPNNSKRISQNEYKNIDNLVYDYRTNIQERIESKKKIIEVLTQKKKDLKDVVQVPIKTMVNIANNTFEKYINNLDENTKKDFYEFINEDTSKLKDQFDSIKKEGINKLNNLLNNESDIELKNRISETLEKLRKEQFDRLTYMKVKTLVESI